MAEVFGLVASVAGIVQLSSEITKLTFHYINSVRRASDSKKQYYQEVSGFNDLLVRTLAALRAAEARPNSTIPVTLDSEAVLQCRDTLLSIKYELEQPSRRWKWPFREGELKKSIEGLHRFRSMFSDYVATSTFLDVDKLTSELNRAKLLDWIGDSAGPIQTRRIEPQEGSGQWFLTSKAFERWRDGSPGLLWCHGAPGVGKSVLSTAVEHSLAGKLVASYHCHFSIQKELQSPKVLLRHLLRQVIQKLDLESIAGVIDYCPEPDKLQTAKGTAEVLVKACSLHKEVVFILLDGPDELKEPEELMNYMKALASNCKILVTSRDIPHIRKTVGCAQEIGILANEKDLRAFVEARMRSCDIWDDIEDDVVVKGIIGDIVRRVSGTFLLAKLLTDHLLQLSTIGEVRNCIEHAPSELRQQYEAVLLRIDSLSPSQKALARRAIGWITHAERPLTVLELIHALAVKPSHGNASKIEDHLVRPEKLLHVCQGLIEIASDSNIISMIHASAQDFFREHFDDNGSCHFDIAETCLQYLCRAPMKFGPCSSWTEMSDRMNTNPFFAYSGQCWGTHITNDRAEKRLFTQIMKLIDNEKFLASAFQILLLHREPMNDSLASMVLLSMPSRQTALHMAAYWDLHYSAAELLKRGLSASAADSQSWSPLHWACFRRHTRMVSLLLDNNADINSTDNEKWTPIFWSATIGHVDCVSLLLDRGADHRARSRSGWTCLHWATTMRQLEVVKVLLDHYRRNLAQDRNNRMRRVLVKDIQLKDIIRSTRQETTIIPRPIDIAVKSGDEDLFQAIATCAISDWHSIDDQLIGTWDEQEFDRTPQVSDPWRTYAKSGFVWYYESNVIDGRNPGEWASALLMVAIRDGRLDALEILIHRGADVNYDAGEQKKPRYPLHAAAYRKDPRYAKILLAQGANPNQLDEVVGLGVTALHLAVLNGFEETAAEILDAGAIVNAPASAFTTASPMRYSIYPLMGDDEYGPIQKVTVLSLVPTLMDLNWYENDDVESCPREHRDEGLPYRMVKLLLRHGASINVANNDTADPMSTLVTALHAAAIVGNDAICVELLNAGADPFAVDECGRNVLHCIAQRFPRSVVDTAALQLTIVLILDKAQTGGGSDALFAPLPPNVIDAINEAMSNRPRYPKGGNSDGIDLKCVQINERDNAVMIAAKLGNWDVFCVLLDHDAPLPPGPDLQSLLWLATKQLQADAIRRIVKLGTRITNFPREFVPELVRSIVSKLKEAVAFDTTGSEFPSSFFLFTSMLQSLLDAGANVNGKDDHFADTAITDLVRLVDSESVVDSLLSSGADPYESNARGVDTFIMAAIWGREKSLRRLIDFALENPCQRHWTFHLVEGRSKEMSDLENVCLSLERSGAINRKNKQGDTILHQAAEAGNTSFLQILLKHGNFTISGGDGLIPLQVAIFAGHTEAARVILPSSIPMEARVDRHIYLRTILSQPKAGGKCPMRMAVEGCNIPMVAFLLEHGALPNTDTSAPECEPIAFLCEAAKLQNKELAKTLLLHGADPNCMDSLGWSPLHIACNQNEFEIADLLLEAGANVNARTREWPTDRLSFGQRQKPLAAAVPPLNIAAKRLNITILKLLLDHSADVSAKSETPYTGWPLQQYPWPAETAIITAFEEGINTWYDVPPRIEAAEIIQVLVDHGADITGVLNSVRDISEKCQVFEGREELWNKLRSGSAPDTWKEIIVRDD